MARVFIYGMLLSIPANLLETLTGGQLKQDTLVQSSVASFVLIAPVEEFFKLLAVWVSVYRRADFQTPVDGIVFAVTAGLAFASVENALYLSRLGPEIWYSRLFFATPAHMMFSVMWGYSLGVARFTSSGEIAVVTKGFLLATFFHGSYNFLVALSPQYAKYSLVPLLLSMGWVTWSKIKRLRTAYPFPAMDSGPVIVCPDCSAFTPECERVCRRCGAAIREIDHDSRRYCGQCRFPLRPEATRCPGCGAVIKSCGFGDAPELI